MLVSIRAGGEVADVTIGDTEYTLVALSEGIVINRHIVTLLGFQPYNRCLA